MRVVIYGAFSDGKYIVSLLGSNADLIGYGDSDVSKQKVGYVGLPVWDMNGLKNVDFDKIIIAAKSYRAISAELTKAGLESRIYRDSALNNTELDEYDLTLQEILTLDTVEQHLHQMKHTVATENGTFSFGKNWEHFVDTAIDSNVCIKHTNELA